MHQLGDVGTTFYIILEGQISLKVPNYHDVVATAEDLLVFMIENEAEIDWKQLA